jgi:hypothetical protein
MSEEAQIREMIRQAGRALDAEVDREIFGQYGVGICPKCGSDHVSEGLLYPGIGCGTCGWRTPYADGARLAPHYSTALGDAWLVVDHFWSVDIEKCDSVDERYLVTITARDGREWTEKADTAPLAICRAALLANWATALERRS